jgi:hypothetical protein
VATFAELKRFGLALPGTESYLHLGQPALRANRKMFALWWAPDKTTILKLERHHQQMLFEVRPDVFTRCKVGTGAWSYVNIGKIDRDELKALVTEAWTQVVPKKISRQITAAKPR